MKKIFLVLSLFCASISVNAVANWSKDTRTTASGLKYKVIKEGKGKSPTSKHSEVTIHYEGHLLNGDAFDSSYKHGKLSKFKLNSVISGWVEGVSLMREGSVYQFTISSGKDYGGSSVSNAIKPHSTLVFDVELIEVHD